jgi:hypothetical protein
MKRLDINDIRNILTSYDYTLLSTEYKNNKQKILIECNKGHKSYIMFNSFQNGHRCPTCFGTPKYSFKHVKEIIEADGYTLLSNTYENNKKPLQLMCNLGHKYNACFSAWVHNQRCPKCGEIKSSEKQRYPYEKIVKDFSSVGYTLNSQKYYNNRSPLYVTCDKGHIYTTTYGSFKSGARCNECLKKRSLAEKEIEDYLKFNCKFQVNLNDKTQILNYKTNKQLELDFYFPELKKAIEFNGEYWHSKENVKQRDTIKRKQCKEKNIDLLIINEKEWLTNKNFVFNKINMFIGGV